MTKLITALVLSAALVGQAAALSTAPLSPASDDAVTPVPLGDTLTPELMPLPKPYPGWIEPDTSATPADYLA